MLILRKSSINCHSLYILILFTLYWPQLNSANFLEISVNSKLYFGRGNMVDLYILLLLHIFVSCITMEKVEDLLSTVDLSKINFQSLVLPTK